VSSGESMLEAPVTAALITDEVLVRCARGGDLAARERLFERHRGDSYRVAYRLLGNEQDALDVVQEAMLKAFSALSKFDGRSEFRTWLLRIVTNAAHDWGRRRKRRTALRISDEDGGSPEPSIEEDPTRRLSQQDLRQALDRALDRLTPTIRTTFVLFAEAGLSYKEIAETQDVPIGTVMSRIHAAREKLQAELDWGRLANL
jgi:RNA polymerase sigma-70 factor, ECF subfamily